MSKNNFYGIAISIVIGIVVANAYPSDIRSSFYVKNAIKTITILLSILYRGGNL